MLKAIEDILIFIFLYIPPLVFFARHSKKRGVSRFLLMAICVSYLALSVFTQNLLPFILVLINIRYMRNIETIALDNENKDFGSTSIDYLRYGFNIKNFRIVNAIVYSLKTYSVTIVINVIMMIILSASNINLKEQEIVLELMNVPLSKFVYMIPILVVFAPIVEEFTFRWLLFEKIFRPRIGFYAAAILSSVMFALIHFNLRALPVLISIGLINCYLIDKKGYWYAVFNHFVFNMVSTLYMLIQKIH
jgi:membrane protease YdiL (CAAX protease family)